MKGAHKAAMNAVILNKCIRARYLKSNTIGNLLATYIKHKSQGLLLVQCSKKVSDFRYMLLTLLA